MTADLLTDNDVLTKAFWQDARERCIRTFLQVLVATLPAQTVVEEVVSGDLQRIKMLSFQALIAAAAAGLSLLWSLIAAKKPNTISPASSVVVQEEAYEGDGFEGDSGESYNPEDLATVTEEG
jgi:hypothetical protein